jgi:hypothetical protein
LKEKSGLALAAGAIRLYAVAADSSGNIYMSDASSHNIRKLTPLVPAKFSVTKGDGQTGPVGTRLTEPLTVKLLARNGMGVPGTKVEFAVGEGAPATLSASSVVTQIDGSASVSVVLGTAPGTISITASVAGVEPARFTLTATAIE